MNQAQVAEQFEKRVKKNTNLLFLVLTGSLTLLLATAVVVGRWPTFNVWSKLNSIVLILALIGNAFDGLIARKRGPEESPRFRAATKAYLLVILTIIVFGIH